MADFRGGSFAPPLSDEKLAYYWMLAESAPGPLRDAMLSLLACCETWWNLPDPIGTATRPHSSGVGTIVRLNPEHATALWGHIPWDHELAAIQSLFDAIPTDQWELRNAAFHILWHVKELDLNREPLTNDKLR